MVSVHWHNGIKKGSTLEPPSWHNRGVVLTSKEKKGTRLPRNDSSFEKDAKVPYGFLLHQGPKCGGTKNSKKKRSYFLLEHCTQTIRFLCRMCVTLISKVNRSQRVTPQGHLGGGNMAALTVGHGCPIMSQLLCAHMSALLRATVWKE